MKATLILSLLSLLVFHSSSMGQDPQKTPDLSEAATLNKTVVKLFNEKKYREALPLALRSLEIQERLLPPDDERIELSLKQVGDLQFANNNLDAARDTYNRLLKKQVLRVGANDLALTSTLERLAVVYFRDNNDREAELASMRALTIREAKLGQNHPDVARTLYGLGEQFRMRGKASTALPLYLRALTIYGEQSGVKSPDFERVSQAFSCSIYESGRDDLFKDLKDIRNRYGPPETDPVPPKMDVLNARAVSLPKPEYPPSARILKEAGVVVVKVTIGEDGKVTSAIDMCQAPPNIGKAAIYAALKARFSPTTISGKPVTVTGVIQYRFIKMF